MQGRLWTRWSKGSLLVNPPPLMDSFITRSRFPSIAARRPASMVEGGSQLLTVIEKPRETKTGGDRGHRKEGPIPPTHTHIVRHLPYTMKEDKRGTIFSSL